MASKVKAIPDGYYSVTPYLIFDDAAEAISFYKQAFGAEELFRMPGPDGKIVHAEIRIGNSCVMLADGFPELGIKSAKSLGGSAVAFMLYVNDVDAQVKLAIESGGRLSKPIENKFYGDRSGQVDDPFGYSWTIATHVEDVSSEEMSKRAKAAMQGTQS